VVRALMQRVRSAVHRPGQFAPDNHFGAEVKVTLTGGVTLVSRVDIQRGRTADDPIPAELLRAKFEDCAARAVPAAAARRIAELIDGLERLDAVSTLTELFQPKKTT
jgi:hypothetical protein